MSKLIKCNVDTKLRIPISELKEIQGELKFMSEENASRLRKSFIEDGVDFAFHVWKDKKSWWLIDGHGRTKLLRKMMVEEGFSIEDLPCVETKAKTFEEAKLKVLRSSSIYHQTSKQGLYEFMEAAGLAPESLGNYNIPDISIPDFKMEFYGSPGQEEEKEVNTDTPSLEDYKNATVKQIVLYYSSKDFEVAVEKLDKLMESKKLADYSEVVWSLLHSKK